MAKDEKGQTNMVKLRNTAEEGGRLVLRSVPSKRTDGMHVSVPKKSNPGKTAWYDGNNRAVQLYALGGPNHPPGLEPVDDHGRDWLKDVRARYEREQADLADE